MDATASFPTSPSLALGQRPPSVGGGGDGAPLFAMHHAGRNGSAPDRHSSSAAAAGGTVAMAERQSGDADLPGVNAVVYNDVGEHDCCKGDNGGGNDISANCSDNDSNGSIQEDNWRYDHETVFG
jgi:hypothetical protein